MTNPAHRQFRGPGSLGGQPIIHRGGEYDRRLRQAVLDHPASGRHVSVVRGPMGAASRALVRVRDVIHRALCWLFEAATEEDYLAASPGACGLDSTRPPSDGQGSRLLPTQE